MKKPSFYSSHFFNFKYEDDSDDGEITDDDDDAYISNCVHFFLQNSNDTKIESIKNELVQKNSSLFACFAAYCLNETDFVTFYEKFKLDINSIEKPGKVTPLISSLMNTKYDTLNVILTKYKDKVNVNCKTAKGITPLHIICNRGRNEEIKESEKLLMTFNGLLKNEKESAKGYTPLHLAILNKNFDAIRLLLNDKDVDVNAQDSSRNTPLHYIVRSDSCYEMLTLFHDYAGKELDIMKTNINKETPLQIYMRNYLHYYYNEPSFMATLELFVTFKKSDDYKQKIKELIPKKIIVRSSILRDKLGRN
ncbi:hypothetical protein M9Y10_013967 [Tritrichomonas musculus]|uniref:Ankyrin repeat protein n=1 Tax=Tritrichomonas musculus TaxID=1915356 RepID=A0ABR2KY88_9EUKA